jgi:hypothetical protein
MVVVAKDGYSRNMKLGFGRRDLCVLLLALAAIGATTLRAAAQGAWPETVKAPIEFDIPAQPLSKALFAFSAATGIEIVVDARNAAGHRSVDLKGVMSPVDALAILLAGSSLLAQEFGPNTITLKSVDAESTQRPIEGRGDQQLYFADIQRAVVDALCRDSRTLPGGYRLALKLWIGQSGQVLRSKRLDSTGDDNLDGVLDAAVRTVQIGRAPPIDLPQPIVLLILPRPMQESMNCPTRAPDMRRSAIR